MTLMTPYEYFFETLMLRALREPIAADIVYKLRGAEVFGGNTNPVHSVAVAHALDPSQPSIAQVVDRLVEYELSKSNGLLLEEPELYKALGLF